MSLPRLKILLVYATAWEVRPLLKTLRSKQVVAVRLGMGAAQAGGRLAQALAQHNPQMVLLAGFSGAVREGQRTGDIALPAAFSSAGQAQDWTQPDVYKMRTLVQERLQAKKLVLQKELRQVSVSELAGPERKGRLGRLWPDACGVDMESYELAGICLGRGVPFVCVRAIFDEVRQDLPSVRKFWNLPLWYSRWRLAAANLAEAVKIVERVA